MSNFDRIPDELKTFPNWVVWRYEQMNDAPKPTKVPYDPLNRQNIDRHSHASTVQAKSWARFEDALRALDTGIFHGIGFVFSVDDPYCGIDLDDTNGDALAFERQKHIHDAFNTYSEISPSGRGVHMIVKASVPAGRKRSFVEIYSAGRFFTMTGNVYNDKPIEERQYYTETLWKELDTSRGTIINKPGDPIQRHTDKEVYDACMKSANAVKFNKLWKGEWRDTINERTGIPYTSQSEADQALINIIAFHTQNRDQIHNMFLQSALGQREKARRVDYVQRNITKAFDQQVPMIDLEAAKNNILAELAEKKAARAQPSVITGAQAAIAAAMAANPHMHMNGAAVNPGPTGIIPPPGLVGEVAQFIYANADRPVPEIATMGSLGFFAGVCGRAFNVSGTGLNMYLLMLAETGRGKDAMTKGIDKIVSNFIGDLPAAQKFVGPARLESGQALIKEISGNQSFVTVVSEFDKFLSSLNSYRATSPIQLLKGLLLELYGKSGEGLYYGGAAYSDKTKSVAKIASPAFSILAECTPGRFYDQLNSDMIYDGFLPRFLMLEYRGIRVEQNSRSFPMDASLKKRLGELMFQAIHLNNKNAALHVKLDPDAERMSIAYSKFCDDEINNSNIGAVAELWNRAHLKILKLAALIAVGCNWFHPTITADNLMWAINLVERDVRAMIARFDQGAIGNDDSRQLSDMRKIILEYVERPYEAIAAYQVSRNMHEARVIPYVYIQRRLCNLSSFSNDRRMSATAAIQKTLATLMATGEIVQVNPEQASLNFGKGGKGKAYIIQDLL